MDFVVTIAVIGALYYLYDCLKNKTPLVQKTNNIIMDSKDEQQEAKRNYKPYIVLFFIIQLYIIHQLDTILELLK